MEENNTSKQGEKALEPGSRRKRYFYRLKHGIGLKEERQLYIQVSRYM
jgi:hypothetical protein